MISKGSRAAKASVPAPGQLPVGAGGAGGEGGDGGEGRDGGEGGEGGEGAGPWPPA